MFAQEEKRKQKLQIYLSFLLLNATWASVLPNRLDTTKFGLEAHLHAFMYNIYIHIFMCMIVRACKYLLVCIHFGICDYFFEIDLLTMSCPFGNDRIVQKYSKSSSAFIVNIYVTMS